MSAAEPWHSQDRHVVRLEWGPDGADPLARYAAEQGSRVIAVVVDVLSFTTCVSVAADRGIAVLPFPWRDDRAADFATANDAVLAQGRGVLDSSITLSPGTIRAAVGVERLVLPSPNGSTTSGRLAATGATVLAASLRNRSAVAGWLAAQLVASPREDVVVLLVPSGERWTDGTLRPAVEDLWGAGAVADALVSSLDHRAGPLLLSPEAEAAVAAWQAAAVSLADHVAACASGRELVESGWADDVSVAAELDSSAAVPVLVDGAFRDRATSLADGAPEC
ncbi:MAG: 2-phosphosulfolactate phosphatase [Terracoccus sp.]